MKKTIIMIFVVTLFTMAFPQDFLLKNATVYTFDKGILKDTDILIRYGKISRIARDIPSAPGMKEIDLTGHSVIPGIIDSHNHIGLAGGINEFSENITPEVSMANAINSDDVAIFYCLTGGVTMTHTMHGSANPIGGENIVIKLKWGRPAEELWEKRATRTIKFALGENPKMANSPTAFPSTRAGISYSIQKSFIDAKEYRKKWNRYRNSLRSTKKKDRSKLVPPGRDFRMEALLEILDKKMVVRCHSYRAEESLELIRLSHELGFKIAAFEHIHQAYRIADELAKEKIGISIFIDSWNYKNEAAEFTPYGLELLHEKGVEISLNSDTSEIMRRLYMEAGKMRRYAGMDDLEALKTITLNPAKMLGVDGFTGSIEEGKEADLAIFDGHPLSGMSKCMLTMIEGVIYYDRAKDKFAGPPRKEVKK